MNNDKKQSGFSLIELSVVLVIMGSIAVGIGSIVPSITGIIGDKKNAQAFEKAKMSLLGFVISNNRLPCPDIDGNGSEGTNAIPNCNLDTNTIGNFPYNTLGLSDNISNSRGQFFEYAIYRKPDGTPEDDADLAVVEENRSSGGAGEDFCQALINATGNTENTYIYIDHDSSTLDNDKEPNVAFVLVDKGENGELDGLNTTIDANDFNPSDENHTLDYDDTVYAMSFVELAGFLKRKGQCQ